MFYIGLYGENHEKIFFSETTRHWYDASPSEPLPSLFKLYPRGQNRHSPWGHMFYMDLYREKHEKVFLSETIWPRDLIFGM